MKLIWQQAPFKTEWGDEMMVATVAIDKDHTLGLYCEASQTARVEAILQRKPLTDEQIQKCYETTGHYQTLRPQDRFAVFALARAIERAHGIGGGE